MSSAPAQAALPLMANNQEMPSLAPVLEQVTPAVVNISVSGKKITRQRLPEQFRFFFGPNMPDEQVSEQPGGTHADEIETSMMLYMAPEHVDMSKAVRDFTPKTKPAVTFGAF